MSQGPRLWKNKMICAGRDHTMLSGRAAMINKHTVKTLIIFMWVSLLTVSVSVAPAQSNLRLSVDEVNSDVFPVVEASISILSAQGVPIKGLTEKDIFAVEDGQAVTDLQVSATYNKPLEIALVIDVSHSMGYGNNPLDSLKDVVKEFVKGLAANDQLAVIAFSGSVTVTQDLTADRSAIEKGIDTLSTGNSRA